VGLPDGDTCAIMNVTTTGFAGRRNGRAVLYLRYRLENGAPGPRRARLFAAIRPFQVNPPWQAFGDLGGMRRIAELAWDGRAIRIDDTRVVVPLSGPCEFGAAAFAHGEITTYLARGELPRRTAVADLFGYASGADDVRRRGCDDRDVPRRGRAALLTRAPRAPHDAAHAGPGRPARVT
jgi:hypothetical protein